MAHPNLWQVTGSHCIKNVTLPTLRMTFYRGGYIVLFDLKQEPPWYAVFLGFSCLLAHHVDVALQSAGTSYVAVDI